MTPPNCSQCGQPVDLTGDAWSLQPDRTYRHLVCPPRAAAGGPALPRFLTIDEAADFLRTSKSTIRARVRTGELPAKRLKNGQNLLFEVRDILALLENARPEDQP